MKTTYICQLPQQTQDTIKKDIETYLISEGLNGQELQDAVQDALNGRLADIEGTIDISKYL